MAETGREGATGATFASRGVAVPFSTPMLGQARVREDSRRQLEFLVPGLSGTRAIYVIPIRALTDVVKMSLFDRALVDEIAKRKLATPWAVRRSAIEVMAMGLAGADAMNRGRAEQAELEELRLFTHFTLVRLALDQIPGAEHEDLVRDMLALPDGIERAKIAIRRFARSQGVDAVDALDRLEAWAELGSALGAPTGEGRPGYLRRQLKLTERLALEVEAWSQGEATEMRYWSSQIAQAARAVAFRGRAQDTAFSSEASSVWTVLSQWDASAKRLKRTVEGLWWLLDGWDRMVQYWEKGMEGTRWDQRNAVTLMYESLPILPAEAVDADERAMWDDIREKRAELVSDKNRSARSDIDDEARRRLEKYRAELG